MKIPRYLLLFCAVLPLAAVNLARAANAAVPATALDQHTLDKRTGAILNDLKLPDAATEKQVRSVLEQHLQAMQVWHAQVDPQLKTLWTDWAAARSTGAKDETKAEQVGAKIDAVYAQFRPEHDAFLAKLAAVLSPAQVDAVKDAMTKSPGLKRTYDAYLQIVPALTEEEKKTIHQHLEVAREQAMDTPSDKEKANIFKRQKVKCEALIDAHGYDWKKSYAAFAAKLNEGKAAPKK